MKRYFVILVRPGGIRELMLTGHSNYDEARLSATGWAKWTAGQCDVEIVSAEIPDHGERIYTSGVESAPEPGPVVASTPKPAVRSTEHCTLFDSTYVDPKSH